MKRAIPLCVTLALLCVRTNCSAEEGSQAAHRIGYAQHLADLVNQYRQQHGLKPLVLARNLSSIAQEHTSHMAALRHLSHDGFGERFERTHATICVENVGWNFRFPEDQLQGWRASPGHDRNLLEPKITQMGVAVSRAYVTFFACS